MKKKKKIFFIIPRFHVWGGAEKITHTIVNSIDYDKFDVTLVLLENVGDLRHSLNKEVKMEVLYVYRIRYYLFKFIPYIIKHKPDIVFTGWGELSAYLSFLIPFFPKIKFVARETNIVTQHVTRKEIRFFYKFYNNFSKIIVQSKDMQQDLIENIYVKPDKLELINNPINIAQINEKIVQSAYPEEFDRNAKNVVAIGNVSYRKGFDNLLKVFSHLKDENINLYILGDGADMKTFQQMKSEMQLEKVHFLGRKTNPIDYLCNSDLFVLSSRYEGFPNVLLEAGACGIYSIANDCKGGINEIIQDGINGKISPIENHKHFAALIKEALNQNHDRELIKQIISERYDLGIIIPKYIKIFKDL